MSNNPTSKPSWQQLEKLARDIKQQNITDLFDEDPSRFENLSVLKDSLLFDYSKHHINQDVMNALLNLLDETGFKEKRDAMFSGEKINHTENRSVLHTALRRPINDEVLVDSEDIIPEIHETLSRIKQVSEKLHAQQIKGATDKNIDTIVSIGVGGSDLSIRMAIQALKTKYTSHLKTHFVSNIDGEEIQNVLAQCNPETTLFVVVSKSFKTQETLTNAQTARAWLQDNLPSGSNISPHFIAVSSNIDAATKFGVKENSIYPMWDWVNGRFSLWSAVGLPIALHYGFDVFREILDGAYKADQDFLNDDLDQNIPVIMALLGIWNRNFMDYGCHAILPYTEKLKYMPAHIQQLKMESNGKNIDNDGQKVNYKTCPVIFGDVGTNGQHSFFQLLHQGSDKVPCDFIGVRHDENGLKNHHKILLNNMLAQGQTMLQGKRYPNNPYNTFEGNIPCSTMIFDQIDAISLGYLIALYEHKTFTQGVLWNINSFDQYGIELGKELARKLENNDISDADPSTKALYSYIHKD
ncbi:MAG: glucose-6-phosphate isomerase [Pseudomonadota bacterium]